MARRLRRRAAEEPPAAQSVVVVEAAAESLPLDDASFDTVVCTLVLCSVDDPAAGRGGGGPGAAPGRLAALPRARARRRGEPRPLAGPPRAAVGLVRCRMSPQPGDGANARRLGAGARAARAGTDAEGAVHRSAADHRHGGQAGGRSGRATACASSFPWSCPPGPCRCWWSRSRVPIVAAFAIAPQFGLAVGALAAGTLIVVAARTRYDEPIEVAPRRDDRYRLLVVASRELSAPEPVEQLADLAEAGARALGVAADPELVVLAPAVSSALDRWASDVAEARAGAQRRLAVSVAALLKAGLEARGAVGDADAVQAIEDELRGFPAQEVAVLRGPGIGAAELEEIRRRLDRPVRELG